MSNKNRKCKFCQVFKLAVNGVIHPIGWFCSMDHALKYAREKQEKATQAKYRKLVASERLKEKDDRKVMRARKEAIKPKA